MPGGTARDSWRKSGITQVDMNDHQNRMRERIVGTAKHAQDWKRTADNFMEDCVKGAVKAAVRLLPGGTISSSRTRMQLKFDVDIDTSFDGKKTVQLCEDCFVSFCNHNGKRWLEEKKQTLNRRFFEDDIMANLRDECRSLLARLKKMEHSTAKESVGTFSRYARP